MIVGFGGCVALLGFGGCVVLCFWLDGYCFDFYFLVFIVHRILADAFASLRAWRFVGGRSLGAGLGLWLGEVW